MARVPERKEKEVESKTLFNEIMAEKSPNLTKDIILQIQEIEQIPNRINPKKSIWRNIIAT